MISARERGVLVMRDASADASVYFPFTCDAGVSHGWVLGHLFSFSFPAGCWILHKSQRSRAEGPSKVLHDLSVRGLFLDWAQVDHVKVMSYWGIRVLVRVSIYLAIQDPLLPYSISLVHSPPGLITQVIHPIHMNSTRIPSPFLKAEHLAFEKTNSDGLKGWELPTCQITLITYIHKIHTFALLSPCIRH